jgi:hypothetical protein
MFYCLTKHQIQQLAYGRLKPKSVLKFENQLLFTYTGEDIQQQAHRNCPDDIFETIAEAAALSANLGDCLAEEVSNRIVEDKLVDPDR